MEKKGWRNRRKRCESKAKRNNEIIRNEGKCDDLKKKKEWMNDGNGTKRVAKERLSNKIWEKERKNLGNNKE